MCGSPSPAKDRTEGVLVLSLVLQAESGRTSGSYLSPGIVELEDGVDMTMVRLGEGSVTMVCNSERPFGMDA